MNTVNNGEMTNDPDCNDLDPNFENYNVFWVDNDYSGGGWQGVNEPPDPEFTVKVYVVNSKFAVTDVLLLIVMFKELFVPVAFPLQPVKVYPVLGVAVTVTEVPCAYSPPEVLTLPVDVIIPVTSIPAEKSWLALDVIGPLLATATEAEPFAIVVLSIAVVEAAVTRP